MRGAPFDGYHRAVDEARAPGRLRRALRLIGWNVLILFVLCVLAAGGAEAYLRLTDPPFQKEIRLPVRLVPGVGVIRPPHAEMRYTNEVDFQQVSHANSLGFVDREPPGPERAAASCHVTLIGDSFVEALEVPIADKAQVRLEELAARELPELDVTTSAFGHRGTAQINQLAFYDVWARGLSPDVVVLVAAGNDLWGNSLPLSAWEFGFSPDHPPWRYARRGADGEMEFVPPAASLEALRANVLAPMASAGRGANVLEWSYLANRLWPRAGFPLPYPSVDERLARADAISRHPRHADFLRGWDGGMSRVPEEWLQQEHPPPVHHEALDALRFALEQFRERAERDGAALVILATQRFQNVRAGLSPPIRTFVGGVIPIIDQRSHFRAEGLRNRDMRWDNDIHWNAVGHHWAAVAILEWLRQNPEVCD